MWTHLIACLLTWLETNVTTFVPVRVSGEQFLLVCWSARYGETLWISVTNVTTFVPVLVPFFAGLLVGSVWRGFVDTSHKCYKFRFCCFALPFDHPAEEGERRWVEHFRSDLGPMWLEFVISSLACPWLCFPMRSVCCGPMILAYIPEMFIFIIVFHRPIQIIPKKVEDSLYRV